MKARHQLGHWHLQIRKLARESAQGVLVEDARLLDVLFSFLLILLLFFLATLLLGQQVFKRVGGCCGIPYFCG